MGIYLNPRAGKFSDAVNSPIFVDQTELILYMNSIVNTEQKYVCISRPRRFGKSITANMLAMYYGTNGGEGVLDNLKLAKHENWDKFRGCFDVIRITMTEFLREGNKVDASLKKMQKLIIRDIKSLYSETDLFDDSDLIQSMNDVYSETNRQFVIIIDEWDAVFRECSNDKDGQRLYLDFLRNWLKDKEYVALAYMTGILPVKKYGKHSALNMFREYSIINPKQMAPYTGFTEEDVKDLCVRYGRPFELIKDWYDGYKVSNIIPPDPGYAVQSLTGREISEEVYSIYSPLSVVEAMLSGMIENYWNNTETFEALAEYIRMDYDGLKDAVTLLMDGECVSVDISTYQNDMTSFNSKDDILTMLIHLGYLCYDVETGKVHIPNKEIMDVFKSSTKSEEWVYAFRAFRKSQDLLNATWECNEEKTADILEWFHDTAENKTYNSEAALSYAVQMAYYSAQKYYTTIQELDSGKGYVDLVYLPAPKCPDKPVLLIELKYDKTKETAVDQIRAKNYPQKLAHYEGNILLVSINYDKDIMSSEYKHHSCKIERA